MAENVKTAQGLAIASVKTLQGLAIASAKTILGVDNTGGGGGSPALIASTKTSGENGGTSGAVDTTGANFICINVSGYGTITVSDSKSNTYTPATAHNNTVKQQLFYCENATVGAGHTFTIAGTGIYASAQFAAFSNVATVSSFDQENGNTGSGSSFASGTITPSQDDTVVIIGLAESTNPDGTTSINNAFTIAEQSQAVAATSEGGAIAYKVLSAAAATSATWSTDATFGWSFAASGIASFKY